jgi:hypothetical protein
MSIKIVNNWNAKRVFSNKLWYRRGVMFPYENRKYLQIGVLGFIILVQWGKMY